MNSAPAELLHLLTYAALQPYIWLEYSGTGIIAMFRRILRQALQPASRSSQPKKTPAITPASERGEIKARQYSKKKPPHPAQPGTAAPTVQIGFDVCCSLNRGIAFLSGELSGPDDQHACPDNS
ncbi:hypothetical protein RCH09_000732 [Actimicrobium sp. GrIS 1.19]|uniref:hypothetical protein n=1 Tax=Actimicrobium sp. GrIS 1.19 TaxID=3071708 RepID=UPI002E07DE92|nr:hypothetical protein [Actimicrobium sp. GrIS 1.19]